MDKDWKLHRYTKKDYTETVEFPVEIVGRDGVVRRYGFEESIRLYQRRITFAAMRYADEQLVEAEMLHCRSRIEQLRRSYFERFGWDFGAGDVDPTQAFGDIAGEIAAFLCRVLQSPGRPEVSVEPVQGADFGGAENPLSVWYVVPHGFTSGMMLYLFRFEGAEPLRERFMAELRGFEAADAVASDGERLIAFHHSIDCGMYLSARGAEFEAYAARQGPEDAEGELLPTRWDQVLKLIRSGRQEEALQQCRLVVAEQPWHRRAYVMGGDLALRLRSYVDAEDFALLGLHFFPSDALLWFHCGYARDQQRRFVESGDALDKALSLNPGYTAARIVRVAQAARRHQWRVVSALLAQGATAKPDARTGQATLASLARLTRAWRVARAAVAGVSVFGVGALLIAVSGSTSMLAVAAMLLLMSILWTASNQLFVRVLEQHTVSQRVGSFDGGGKRFEERGASAR